MAAFAPGAAESLSVTSKASGSVRFAGGALAAGVGCSSLRTGVRDGAKVTTSTIRPSSESTITVVRRVITPYEIRPG